MITLYLVGTQQLQDDVLIALGNPSCSDKSYSESIHPEIIRRVENVLTSGLEKERKDELLKKYLIPNNFALLEAPKLNRELEGLLSDQLKKETKGSKSDSSNWVLHCLLYYLV